MSTSLSHVAVIKLILLWYFWVVLPNSASTQLNFNFNFEAKIALFSDNTATHPTTDRESSKMEQDFKQAGAELGQAQLKLGLGFNQFALNS